LILQFFDLLRWRTPWRVDLVDDYLTFLGSILEEEELAKGDSSLKSLQVKRSRHTKEQNV